MDLLSYFILGTHNSVSCRCCKSKTSRKSYRSYIMYEIAVVAVLLFCIDISFALPQQSDLKTHPKLLVSSAHARKSEISSSKEIADTASNEESQRELIPPGLLKDIKRDDGGVDSKLTPKSKGLFFGEDTNGVPIVVGTWFRYGSYTLAFSMFGTAFLVACVASAIYFVLFVVTEPSQQVRSMDNEEGWNFGRVLSAIRLAYETYETFDPYSPACQLKTICEIQESGHFQGSVLRRLTHFIVHTDMVQKKLASVGDLQAADRIGNDPAEKCTEKYSECRFSLDKLYDKYVRM